MLPTLFEVNWSLVKEEKKTYIFKITARHGGHAGFPIGTILTFDLQVNPMLSTKFQVNWPFGSSEETKKWPSLIFG